jgi:hypothetical protein
MSCMLTVGRLGQICLALDYEEKVLIELPFS